MSCVHTCIERTNNPIIKTKELHSTVYSCGLVDIMKSNCSTYVVPELEIGDYFIGLNVSSEPSLIKKEDLRGLSVLVELRNSSGKLILRDVFSPYDCWIGMNDYDLKRGQRSTFLTYYGDSAMIIDYPPLIDMKACCTVFTWPPTIRRYDYGCNFYNGVTNSYSCKVVVRQHVRPKKALSAMLQLQRLW